MITGNIWAVNDIAEEIKHPIVNSGPKMWKFLRKTGVLDGKTANPILKAQGIVWNEMWDITRGGTKQYFQKVLFSDQGIQWVAQLLNHYYSDGYMAADRKQSGQIARRKWNPFVHSTVGN